MANTVNIDLDVYNELYAKAKAYDEHSCDKPIDFNINITLTKKSLEDLNYKDIEHTVKGKFNRKGGLL